jgi:phosphoglycolate phosphatase-like HAD superfamily hydrolase
MLGPAPIIDFDGTLARLEIDWAGLRAGLCVSSMNDLWVQRDPDWNLVTATEVRASKQATVVAETVAALEESAAFSILTANSERAVEAFFLSRAQLAARLAVVVGRETLDGPKLDPDCFHRGFARCVEATASARGESDIVYLGDDPRELVLARAEGALAYDVTQLGEVA